jgi:hypothetical protein
MDWKRNRSKERENHCSENWSENLVNAEMKSPAYQSAGEKIVQFTKSVSESTGVQVEAVELETEPASGTVQGDSLPSFSAAPIDATTLK